MVLSDSDLKQLNEIGIDEIEINNQIEKFKSGIPFLEIIKAATTGHGIMTLSDSRIEKYISKYEKCLPDKKVIKFVPASGAATRMFKDLLDFIDTYNGTEEDYLNLLSDRSPESIYYFFENLNQFAFFSDLRRYFFNENIDLLELIEKKEYVKILLGILSEIAMNYGNLPKGLIKFHKYEDFSRSSAEEHMVEGTNYSKNSNNQVNIQFTVSDESKDIFKEHINSVQKILEEKFNVKYSISYSTQNPATDTIAVDLNNEPIRNDDGSIVFRPGGHGALIDNLNKINADIIYIKNIDNVVPDRNKNLTTPFKKSLAGILFSFQDTLFKYLKALDEGDPDEEKLISILRFIEKDLNTSVPDDFENLSTKDKISYARKKLNRPIRVCGMVPNEGEPGGGPYYSVNSDSSVSLQIIEFSQINIDDEEQMDIVKNATHFNPVDMVCGIKNYKGRKFNLHQFIDPNTGFISNKSKSGKEIKAYELPGLWNGAMSDWNTIFVELPIETFNPVKVVNDLLKQEHRTYEQ